MIRKIYYFLLNLITFGRGIKRFFGKNEVRLPVRYYKYFSPDYEQENIRIINKYIKPGMSIIDVGAHIGLMSVIFGKKVGQTGAVFSFEPTPSTFEVLKKSVRINNLDSIIQTENAALSDKNGKNIFYISNYNADNSNSLVNKKRIDRNEKPIEVQLYSIDDYIIQKEIKQVDFIKIDAEGAELSVLKGAQNTLYQFRPKVILALHPTSIKTFGHSLEKIWDFITEKNYQVEYQSSVMNKEDFISRNGLFDVFLFQN